MNFERTKPLSNAVDPPAPDHQSELGAGPSQVSATPAWTIADAQQSVDEWIRTIGVRYFSPLTNLAQLMEEVGEVARIISRTYGEQSFKPSDHKSNLADELADVLFVTICLANQCGIDLDTALKANLDKKNHRDRTRHQQNEKLHNSQTSTTQSPTIQSPAE